MNNAPPPTRPDWWPADEAWPPKSWQRPRKRFMWRAAAAVGLLVVLVTGACTMAFWISAFSLGLIDTSAITERIERRVEQIEQNRQLPAPRAPIRIDNQNRGRFFFLGPLTWLLFMAGFILLVRRAFRSIIAPLGDVMTAAQRVETGDYSARVNIRGNRDVRALARSFNAMATRLQDNETQRRNLMADVTHELRTPLTVIQGNLEGMVDGVYPHDESHLQTVLEETHVMARLIEDLRMLSLADSGTLKLQKERANLRDVANDALASLAAASQDAGVALVITAAEQPDPDLEFDPLRIREVLTNLLSNALRHTPRGGTITIAFQSDAKDMRVTVTDNGSGISAEDLPHIFNRFYKTQASRGTGLGLAIARSLVQAHGGEISAASTQGSGTTIAFTLPLLQA